MLAELAANALDALVDLRARRAHLLSGALEKFEQVPEAKQRRDLPVASDQLGGDRGLRLGGHADSSERDLLVCLLVQRMKIGRIELEELCIFANGVRRAPALRVSRCKSDNPASVEDGGVLRKGTASSGRRA